MLHSTIALAQNESRIYLLHSDRLFHDSNVDAKAQILVGNVQFRHEDILMYCDSALFYEESNSLDAFGNVRMLQGDTVSLDGDILYYNGLDKLARVRNNVVLVHGNTTLYTDSLDYDRLYNVGYFFEGGRLVTPDNDMTSDWGEYRPDIKLAIFIFQENIYHISIVLLCTNEHNSSLRQIRNHSIAQIQLQKNSSQIN